MLALVVFGAGLWWFVPGRDHLVERQPSRVPEQQTQPAARASESTAPSAPPVEVRFEVEPPDVKLSVFNDRGLAHSARTDEQGVHKAQLPPGRYEIELQKDGYQLLSQGLEIDGAGTHRFALTPLRGALTVATTPGAKVTAEGAGGVIELGTADARGELRYDRLVEGKYALKIEHPDYFEGAASVEIRKDRPAQVRQMLRGKPGGAYISASPQAEVWVDGVRKGRTGERIGGLEPGARAFEVKRAGYRTERFSLEIPPNRDAPRKVLGELVRESGALRIEAEVPDYARAHFQGLEKRVRIGSDAWKTVTLPYEEDGLACEPITVELQVPGYRVGRAVPGEPRIEDGKTATVRFTLMPEDARLTVTANAPYAEVYDESGRRLGGAGTALAVPSLQALSLTIRAAGYEDKVERLAPMEPGKAYTRSVALEERKERRPGEEMVVDLGGGVRMVFCWIPPGKFMMGSPYDEPTRDDDEGPQHEVTISSGFWMGKYEVTQRQYERLMGGNPSYFKNAGPDAPVEKVTWHQAVEFCKRLQAKLPAELRGRTVRRS